MKIINPYTEILTPLDGQAILQHIELCGRVCYKSEDKITDTSAAKFVAGIIKRGHEAVLEHFDITVKFVCDRCPQAGSCLLNYLGKACHKLRMQECPEVVPTTLELMHNMDAEELATFLSKTVCQSLGKTQLLEWLNKEVPNETL